ncbi:efflux RND transporter periplasmic adaptor subunit [Bosea sp. BK604]|uniref:efflux RND transporter periplasmic adaptor subunit n=1 Tax=Bosea sp. BK604 TaxID=2512180 RepID=UPI0010500B84|nr:efflux RND transporter periplasmic adaptor subunit [Bosea sp. BK604]TCR63106.1 macrolide-specific efflux system membrane fusion protein [Bosea sp. BK604]
MRLRRLVLPILIVAAAGGFYLWQSRQAAKTETISLPSVEAVIGDVEEAVLASGALEPVRQVSVGAQVSGRLISLKVKLGQNVAAGDLIAEIDGVTQQNALRSAEADLAALQAQRDERRASLAYAESVLARQKQMVGQNAVSRDAYENAEMTVRTTRAQIEALDAQIVSGQVKVETARANLGYTRITAPSAGTVLAIVTLEGQTVNAVQSAPTIVVLGDVSTMTIKAKISEADVLRVKPGQEVYFSVLGAPDQRFPGKISFVEPAPDTLKTQNASSSSLASNSSSAATTTAVYYNALFEVPNPDGRLLTSMTAQVTVVVGRARAVVTVPSTAIRRRGENAFVDVLGEEGRPAPRKVTVGLDNKIVAEISSGLKAGERVVTTRNSGGPDATRPARARRSPFGF